MGSIHDVVDALRREPSNSKRGTALENLTLRYFKLDPMLPQRYDQVSRWINWDRRDDKTDTAIDLVAHEYGCDPAMLWVSNDRITSVKEELPW